MIMNNIITLKIRSVLAFYTLLLCNVLAFSCYEDKGNYDYREEMEIAPIINSTLEESYSATLLQNLIIKSSIENENEHMEYLWFIYPTTNANLPNDTIGYEKDLNYFVTAQSGSYRLVFKVTDTRNGTSAYQESSLNIASVFSTGYYVMKYENSRTDVDFVDGDAVLHPNLLKQLHGEDMPGKPIRQVYTLNRYCYTETDANDNVVSNTWQPAYIICTDEDLRIFHGDDLHLIKTWDNAFMETPAVKKPQGVWGSGSGGFMMMNDDQMHAIQGYIYSDGCFGYAFQTSNLKIAPMLAVGGSSYLAFDEEEGTFIGFNNANGNVITNIYAGVSLPNVVGYDLIWMGSQANTSTPAYTYSLVKNRVDGKWMLVEEYTTYMSMVGHYFTNQYQIPSDFGIYNGKIFACQGGAGNAVIYYSTGDNVVNYYNPMNQTEKKSIITLPIGEKIVQLKHVYFAGTPAISMFLILAQDGDNWKLYTHEFEGNTPDIISNPLSVYEGTGIPGHVMYRSPAIRTTY